MTYAYSAQADAPTVIERAVELYAENGIKDFIFELEWEMYRCKVGAKNVPKVKPICTATVSLGQIINKGTASDPNCHYLIRLRLPPDGQATDVLLSPREFVSHTIFKRRLAARRAVFLGSKGDYEMLLRTHLLNTEALRNVA